MHLKFHEKSCHKKIEMNHDIVTKKRKSTDGSDDILSSSKKTKFACDACNHKTHSKHLLKKHKETLHFD